VRAGLVGDEIGPHAPLHQLGQDLGRIAQQRDATWPSSRRCTGDARQRVVQIGACSST
jgi:hypothetical protein